MTFTKVKLGGKTENPHLNKLNCIFGVPGTCTIYMAWYIMREGGGGRLLECKNPPPVLVNAPPPLLHACQLSAPWALARTVTVIVHVHVHVHVLYTIHVHVHNTRAIFIQYCQRKRGSCRPEGER